MIIYRLSEYCLAKKRREEQHRHDIQRLNELIDVIQALEDRGEPIPHELNEESHLIVLRTLVYSARVEPILKAKRKALTLRGGNETALTSKFPPIGLTAVNLIQLADQERIAVDKQVLCSILRIPLNEWDDEEDTVTNIIQSSRTCLAKAMTKSIVEVILSHSEIRQEAMKRFFDMCNSKGTTV